MSLSRWFMAVVCLSPMVAASPLPGEPSFAETSAQNSAQATTASTAQEPVFHADVDLVLQAVAVLDHDGNPVTDLAREEFRVYENDQPQQIRLFLAPRATPLDVAVVLDASSSLAPWAQPVRRSVRTFLGSLEPLDCVYLLPFNASVGPGVWGRALDPEMGHMVDGIFMNGGTALYDAVWQGLATIEATTTGEPPPLDADAGAEDPDSATGPVSSGSATVVDRASDLRAPAGKLSRASLEAGLRRQAIRVADERPVGDGSCGVGAVVDDSGLPSRRRAVVLFSDGDDEHSRRRFDEVLERVGDAAIPVFPVLMGQARDSIRLKTVLQRLAGSSGGQVVEAASANELKRAFQDVVALLRASYLIGYRPTDTDNGHWRSVSVRSRRPSYRLVYRDRYYR